MSSVNQPLHHVQGIEALIFHIALTRQSNTVLDITGLPGIGKTEIMYDVAKLGVGLLPPDVKAEEFPEGWEADVFSLYVSQHDDVEFMMPFVDPSTAEYSLVPTPLLTRLTKGCYMVYDESKMEGCQRALLQQCSGSRISMGGWVGPRGVTRIMIGNTADAGNFSQVDNAVLGNRTRQIEWTPVFTDWITGFALPYGIHPIILTAVKMEGQPLFLDYDAARTRNATPRSLTNASDAMIAAETYTGGVLSHHQRLEILASCMHDEAALKIQSLFHLHDKLVPYSAIVSQPDTAPIPDNPAALFMTCASVSRQAQPDHWPQVMEWVTRLPLELRGSIVEPAVKRHPELLTTPEFQRYTVETAPLIV